MIYFLLYILSREWPALILLIVGLLVAHRWKSRNLAPLAVLLFFLVTSILWKPQLSPWLAFLFLFLAFYLLIERYKWVLYPALTLGLLLLAVSPIIGFLFTIYVPVSHYAYLEEKGQTVVVREDYYGAFFSDSNIEIITYGEGKLIPVNVKQYDTINFIHMMMTMMMTVIRIPIFHGLENIFHLKLIQIRLKKKELM